MYVRCGHLRRIRAQFLAAFYETSDRSGKFNFALLQIREVPQVVGYECQQRQWFYFPIKSKPASNKCMVVKSQPRLWNIFLCKITSLVMSIRDSNIRFSNTLTFQESFLQLDHRPEQPPPHWQRYPNSFSSPYAWCVISISYQGHASWHLCICCCTYPWMSQPDEHQAHHCQVQIHDLESSIWHHCNTIQERIG